MTFVIGVVVVAAFFKWGLPAIREHFALNPHHKIILIGVGLLIFGLSGSHRIVLTVVALSITGYAYARRRGYLAALNHSVRERLSKR